MREITRNVDESEVAKFSELANEWWNPFGHCKPLHDINPLRFEFISNYVELNGRRALDIGCGGGILTESLAKAGCKVTGIDLSNEAITVARLHAAENDLSINYEIATAEEFAQDHPTQFEVITCMELLEHVPDPSSIIEACANLLKPGGHLFLSTLNRNAKSFCYAILGAEYFLKLLPMGTHQYEKFIKPHELLDMLQCSKLHLTHMAGLHYHPIVRRYSLSRDVSVNYLVHCYKE